MVAIKRLPALLAILLSVASSMANAQLIDCPALGTQPQSYKVVLDELQFDSAQAGTSSSLQGLRELLAFNLSTQLAELQAEVTMQGMQNVPLGLITCAGRKPSVNGSEFTDQRAETLSDQRVVLELWGTLMNGDTGGVASPHAIIGYMVPPLKHFHPNGSLASIHLVRYPKNAATDPGQQLQKLSEASSLALLGLALKAQRARNYDLAVWALTRSEGQIHDAEVAEGLPFAASMREYLQRSACETRETARADASYQGALRLLPAENCGAAP